LTGHVLEHALKAIDQFDWRKGGNLPTFVTQAVKWRISQRLESVNVEIRRQAFSIFDTFGGFDPLINQIETRLATGPRRSDAIAVEAIGAVVEEMDQSLQPREAFVIRRRFGFDGKGAATLQQVGETMGLSRQRVGQIEIVAKNKLRAKLDRELQKIPAR
jgi:RNA polymerase sigma factor (sigma-70 family)